MISRTNETRSMVVTVCKSPVNGCFFTLGSFKCFSYMHKIGSNFESWIENASVELFKHAISK